MDKQSNQKYRKPYKKPQNRPTEKREVPENAVIGRNAVRELLASGRDIDKIFVQSGEREGSINLLIGEASERKIPLITVDKVRLDAMAQGSAHQGIIAMASEVNYASVEDILRLADSRGEPPFIILCDGVEDPHNLGAIIRSAECLGAHGVIIPKRRSVGLTPIVDKTAAGALSHLPVARVANLTETMKALKDRGLWFYAADMGGTSVYETDLKSAVGIVLGNEGEGISRLVKETCDFTVSIPMYGQISSMNVSCAAAVIFAEVAKQRHP